MLSYLAHCGLGGGDVLRVACVAAQSLGRALPAASAHSRAFASSTDNEKQSLYVANTGSHSSQSPILLGLLHFFDKHLGGVGYFRPIGGESYVHSKTKLDKHVELMHSVFGMKGTPEHMYGVTEDEAIKLLAAAKTDDLLDRIYVKYSAYKDLHDMVVVEGNPLGGTALNAEIAAALNAPVLLVMDGSPRFTANDYYDHLRAEHQVYGDEKATVLGTMVNRVNVQEQAILASQLKKRFGDALPFLGAIPFDQLVGSVRLDEVIAALGAYTLFDSVHEEDLDVAVNSVKVATHSTPELLIQLDAARAARPLLVTTADRTDVILAAFAGHQSGHLPLAGLILAEHRHRVGYILEKLFAGLGPVEGATTAGLARRSTLPILGVKSDIHEVIQQIDNIGASILPTSEAKVERSFEMFEQYVDTNTLVLKLEAPREARMTPKQFQHEIKTKCLNNPQKIVLPEGLDRRVLQAAVEIAEKDLAKVSVIGPIEEVKIEASKLGLDLSKINVIDHRTSALLEKYTNALFEARKAKGMTADMARDALADVNVFGTMMVYCGDANGMVSGAIHTTASTIRPGMQVLREKSATVSSVFFMCLPDKVLVYGDCAVNVDPSSEELANIAITSADTAAAFGIEPRVAMLSYSTLGSGTGPQVEKVIKATEIAQKLRPDLKLEGPFQYDAAIDPKVAAVKVKGASNVAGQATVLIFPDLNTGNNTYKAVQQSTGAVAMGPIMQGMRKPVNDLSRGCTVADIVNTVCVTSVQAQAVQP